MNIYDYTSQSIIATLIQQQFFDQDQILAQDEIPTPNITLFCRPSWSYGSINYFTNKYLGDTSLLSLEVYQRKNGIQNNIEQLCLDIRKFLMINTKFVYNNKVANLVNISLIKNTNNQQWNSYTINLNFSVYQNSEV